MEVEIKLVRNCHDLIHFTLIFLNNVVMDLFIEGNTRKGNLNSLKYTR